MLAALTLFLVGVVLACLGLISLYIGHIHAEVKNRPLYVVRNDLRGSKAGKSDRRSDVAEGADLTFAQETA